MPQSLLFSFDFPKIPNMLYKKKKIKITEIKTNHQSKQIKNENIQNLHNKT